MSRRPPFFERVPNGIVGRTGHCGVPPHVRVWRVVYMRHLDWFIIAPTKVRHIGWRFWFVMPDRAIAVEKKLRHLRFQTESWWWAAKSKWRRRREGRERRPGKL